MSEPRREDSVAGGKDVSDGASRHAKSQSQIRCYRVWDQRELEDLYRLRYQVYCLERGFLSPDEHPSQRETDEFDAHSIHVVARDRHGRAIGTARLVRDSALGLPMERHFQIGEAIAGVDRAYVAEVSRFMVSKELRGLGADAPAAGAEGPDAQHSLRRWHMDISLALIKSLYWEGRPQGITHICASIERSLWRMLRSGGFVLRQIGPPGDYYGLCIPCLAGAKELEEIIMRLHPEMLDVVWWPQAQSL